MINFSYDRFIMKDKSIRVSLDGLGKFLRQLRVKKGFTQEELAKKIGTGQAVISRIENGKEGASIRLVQRLADALNLKVELKLTPR